MSFPNTRLLVPLLLAIASLLPTGTLAQDSYPAKPARIIVPFPPSGSTDILGRLVAEILSKDLGQAFLVVNVGGAGGTIGALQAIKSAADGYTLFMGTPSTIINNPSINPKIGYDPLKDFQSISFLWSQPVVVMVNKDGPYRTLKDLIAEARKRPGKLNYGSGGVGNFNHLAGELFNTLAEVQLTHVPYKGIAPAMSDLMGKTLDVVYGTVAGLTSASDRLVGLAVGAPTRSAFVPAVPTSAEAGLPAFVYSSWGGIFGPAGMPPRSTERLVASLEKGLKVPAIRERFMAAGVEAVSSTPEELQKHIMAESRQVKRIIEIAGIKE